MRTSIFALAACLSLAAAGSAIAGPDRASILLGSQHVNADEDFQEFNPGVILTWERRLNYSVGVYYNSFEDVSVMAAVGYDIELAPEFEVGAFIGAAHYPSESDRFKYSAGDIVPLGGVQARYRNVFAQMLPLNGSAGDVLLTFGLTFALD